MDVPLKSVGIEYLYFPSAIGWVVLFALSGIAAESLRRELGRPSAVMVGVCVVFAYLLMGNMSLAVAIAAASVGALVWRRTGHSLVARTSRGAALEILLVLGGYTLYEQARVHTDTTYISARANALKVVDFEKSLGLFFERDLQSLFVDSRFLIEAWTAYYQLGFLSAVTGVLLWLFLADDDNYRLMRNALGISCALGVLAFTLFPTAPPRLMAEFQIVDAASMLGNPSVFANEYAAIPSLHVGWMALAGYALGRSIGGTWGPVVKVAPGLTMAFAVVITGNHWWFDGVLGTTFALGPALVAVHMRRLRTPVGMDEVGHTAPAP